MKPALIALVAVLAPICAAQALENAGPHRLTKPKPACQNKMDADELIGTYINKDLIRRERMWAELGDPRNDAVKRLCVMIPAGAVVTVVERTSGFECVTIKGRPASACFQAKDVTMTPAHRTPVYDGTYILVD